MANTVFVLTIFPFFHVVPALSSDVQPIAGVLAFAVWALGGKRSGLAALLSPLICVLGLYVIIAIAFVEFGAAPSEIARLAEAIALISAPLAVILCLAPRVHLLSPRVLTWCVTSWATLGTLQLFAPTALRGTGISGLLELAIPRTTNEATYLATGRGVDMFAPEPSYAAASIVLMVAATAWMFASGVMSRRRFTVLLMLGLWMIALNQSVTLAVIVLGGALVIVLVTARRHPITLATALAVAFTAVFLLASAQQSTSRPLRVAGQLAGIVTHGDLNLNSLLALSTVNGSGRLATVIQGYAGVTANGWFGLGLGSWANQITAGDNGLITTSAALKPFGYGPFVAMTLGLPGLLALLYALARVCARACRAAPRGLALATVVVAVIGIMVDSPVSLPTYWVMLLFGWAYCGRSLTASDAGRPPRLAKEVPGRVSRARALVESRRDLF